MHLLAASRYSSHAQKGLLFRTNLCALAGYFFGAPMLNMLVPHLGQMPSFEYSRSDFNDKTIEFIAHFDLAAQPTALVAVVLRVESFLLYLAWLPHAFQPFRLNPHVAGCAGTHAAATSLNALYAVFGGNFHQIPNRILHDDFLALG